VIVPYEDQTTNITHKVENKETLYSIARKYKVEVSEIERLNPSLAGGLKANMVLIIPVKKSMLEGDSRFMENEANRLLTQNIPSPRVDVMKVGLLLPFLDETGGGHWRLQEYYEGFLLAVEEMKTKESIWNYTSSRSAKGITRKNWKVCLKPWKCATLILSSGE